MKKRIQKLQLPFGIMLAGLLLLSASLLKVPVAALKNKLMEDFVRCEQQGRAQIPENWEKLPYSAGGVMGKFLFPFDHLNSSFAPSAKSKLLKKYQFNPDVPTIVTLDVPIRYYAHPGDTQPAFILETGEKVLVSSRGMDWEFSLQVGYGIITLPTQDPQWRYALPLRYADPQRPLNEEMYFVRLDDIREFWKESQKAYPDIEQYALGYLEHENRFELTYKKSQFSDPLLFADWQLYQDKIYVSPNLKWPLWDVWNTVLLVSGSLLAIGRAVIGKMKGKRLPQNPAKSI